MQLTKKKLKSYAFRTNIAKQKQQNIKEKKKMQKKKYQTFYEIFRNESISYVGMKQKYISIENHIIQQF